MTDILTRLTAGLAGESPFTGPAAQAVVAKRLSSAAPRVSILRETVPAGVEAALAKALALTPADRFGTGLSSPRCWRIPGDDGHTERRERAGTAAHAGAGPLAPDAQHAAATRSGP